MKMSVRRPPVKRDWSYRESWLHFKNIELAEQDDAGCEEICVVSRALIIKEDLEAAGWKVKVSPFELGEYLLLRIILTNVATGKNRKLCKSCFSNLPMRYDRKVWLIKEMPKL